MPTAAVISTSRARRLSDPLSAALEPPPNESDAQREARLTSEREAKKVSDIIDEELRHEKEVLKAKARSRQEIKVLLLGQSESGKSTTLKQFQLAYTPNSFRQERLAWRPVVYLNLVRSVRRVLDALLPQESQSNLDDDEPLTPQHRDSISEANRPSTAASITTNSVFSTPKYTELRSHLQPLLDLEQDLVKRLSGGPTEDDEAIQLASPPPPVSPSSRPNNKAEVAVNNRVNWKKALNRFTAKNTNDSVINEADGWWNDPSDLCHIMDRTRPYIERLWNDPTVKAELARRRLRLEESSGFYLDSLSRITDLRYVPSDDDVLKARLKTVGVIEHCFSLETGKQKGVDWKIYDVGGTKPGMPKLSYHTMSGTEDRYKRQAWVPYFQDMNALIFLAPISAFDQVLSEDPRVNRLEDSLLLWRSIVSNKLLAQVNIILFLNKCDLLQAKLVGGVRLSHYMTSYGDRPNDYESVAKYFRNKFLALNQSHSPNPEREVYWHLTAVTDTSRTSSIIANGKLLHFHSDARLTEITSHQFAILSYDMI